MKISLRAACLLILPVLTLGARADEPIVLRTLTGNVSAGIRAIAADNQFGNVTVTAGSGDFGWEWTLRSSRSSPRTEAYAQDCRLEIRETNGALELVVIRPEDDGRSGTGRAIRQFLRVATFGIVSADDERVHSDLTLRVPATSKVDVKNRFGSVNITGPRSPVAVDCQHGRVDLADIGAPVTARTTFATLRAHQVGPAQLTSQNGTLEVRDVAGDLRARASFGRLIAHDVKGEASLTNQNGPIEVVRVRGDLEAKTSFADLRVEEIGGKAELDCRNGKIEATRVTGSLRAANSFGALRVRDIGGSVELDGQNGEITAAGVTGDVRAKTSFARIQLDGNSRRFDARSQNGAVEIIARSPSVERIDASASFAPISVRLPGEAKPLIRATTSFGKVHSDFPVLHDNPVSDATFAADAAPLKISLKGQNGDVRIQQIAAR